MTDTHKLIYGSQFVPVKLLAVIRSPRYGLNERGNLGLTFAAYVAENEGAMQFVPASLANKVIEAYEVQSINDLNGKPCWVTVDKGNCTFHSPCLV